MTQRVYAFTNENLSAYENIYDFNEAHILTVLGSGDQYFASLLYGAKEITLYDSNPETWYFFVLKFYALMILSYEEFIELAVIRSYNQKELLNKIFKHLPQDVHDHLLKFIKKDGNLNRLLMYSPLSHHKENYTGDRIIPYFDKEKYYRLQNILHNMTLPKMFISDLTNLPYLLKKESFDILFASNIFTWLSMEPKEYLKFLRKFRASIIQAHYIWHKQDEEIQKFTDLNFVVDAVPTVTATTDKDFVISKRR